MESFISLFVKELVQTKGDLSGDCVIFPSRRAGLIFKKKFAGTLLKPTWLPAVYSIDDFIASLSTLQVADSTYLVMELFTIYKKLFVDTTFDRFMPWGEMLLKDFNETDLQLVDAEKLFGEIISIKELDALIGISEEEAERIRDFWKLFSGQEVSNLQSAFLNNWRSLPLIYKEFRAKLQQKGLAYTGMAAGLTARQLSQGTLSIPWNHVHFAGFYALSNAEKLIMNTLIKQEKATTWWDSDRYYSEDKRQEAGKYFRKKQVDIPENEFKWTFDSFHSGPKKIQILGVPLQVGQAKYTGILLEQLQTGVMSYDQTAVVLPDEKLLLPVLYSLPPQLSTVNITMGYPLKGSQVEQLTHILKNCWDHFERINNVNSFASGDIIALLENNFFQVLEPRLTLELRNQIQPEHNRMIQPDFIPGIFFNEAFCIALNREQYQSGVISYLLQVVQNLMRNHQLLKTGINQIDEALLLFFYKELKKLNNLTKEFQKQIGFTESALWKLIFDLIKSLRVPFSGEPVKGLQIMGFLETRNLDFENLFILSVNEDVMPGSSVGNSYIPYSIRKAYGLPTYEEQDSIYAYHFYRLLQRAHNIYLLYNTEAGGMSGGEMSRYILQLAYELKKKSGPEVTIIHKRVGTDLRTQPIQEISIPKNPVLLEQIHKLFYGNDKERKKWSATALSSFIACKLQFYFRYVAGIREPDDVKLEIDPAVFGNIIHSVMEQFYQNQTNITSGFLKTLYLVVEETVEQAIRKSFPTKPGKLTGKNSLLKTVMIDLVKKILDQDQQDAPFTIQGLERPFEYKLESKTGSVSIFGKIDRIDIKNGAHRIIDYKTGKDQTASGKTIEELFSNPEYKATFQLMLYAMLYKKSASTSIIKAGLFQLRNLNQGIDFLNEGQSIGEDQFDQFEQRMVLLIDEIMNPDQPFYQTQNEKICSWCVYKDICNR